MAKRLKYLVNGEWKDTESGVYYDITNSSTGEVMAEAPRCTADEVDAAVDWVVSFSEDTPETLIAAMSPDLLVKGGDYRIEDIVGADHVRRSGGEVRVLSFLDGRSTSRIINTIRER